MMMCLACTGDRPRKCLVGVKLSPLENRKKTAWNITKWRLLVPQLLFQLRDAAFQDWSIFFHPSAFSHCGWLEQLPNRLKGILGSPEEGLSGRLIGERRIANLCHLTACQSWQNQVMSCNLGGSTHERMHVTLINLVSLKLQCSNQLPDSDHSSNCQYDMHQCGPWGDVAEVTQTHLSGPVSFLKIFFYMPNKRIPLESPAAGYLKAIWPCSCTCSNKWLSGVCFWLLVIELEDIVVVLAPTFGWSSR